MLTTLRWRAGMRSLRELVQELKNAGQQLVLANPSREMQVRIAAGRPVPVLLVLTPACALLCSERAESHAVSR